jgi:hypothetical protein
MNRQQSTMDTNHENSQMTKERWLALRKEAARSASGPVMRSKGASGPGQGNTWKPPEVPLVDGI